LETVDAAFFRLIGLQYCLGQAQSLVQIRTVSREKFALLAAKKIIRIDDLTRIEQKEIRALQILSKIRSDIELQRNILASAMAVSPDICVDGGIVLIGELEKPVFLIPECELEMQAVQNRPEAYEAGLAHLNSINDLKRTIVKYFPKITGFWRYTRDKDRFLLFNDWHEIGMYMFFDLTDFLSNRDESQAARANTAKTEREMGAVALGLTAQVRAAAIKYFGSLEELEYSRRALAGANRVLRAAEDRYSAQDIDKQTLQEARGDVLEANINVKRVLGEANALLAELQGTMGTNYSEPIPIK
jgi:outer membrane protein TolC